MCNSAVCVKSVVILKFVQVNHQPISFLEIETTKAKIVLKVDITKVGSVFQIFNFLLSRFISEGYPSMVYLRKLDSNYWEAIYFLDMIHLRPSRVELGLVIRSPLFCKIWRQEKILLRFSDLYLLQGKHFIRRQHRDLQMQVPPSNV